VSRKRTYLISVLLGVLACILVLSLNLPDFGGVQWSTDIKSGRTRREVTLCGLTVRRWTYETAFSRMYRRLVGEPSTAEWWVEYGHTWPWQGKLWDATGGGVSTHMDALTHLLHAPEFTDGARRAAMLKYLSMLSDPVGWNDRVSKYEESILDLLVAMEGTKIKAGDLPDP
jgi:hypothetical protein